MGKVKRSGSSAARPGGCAEFIPPDEFVCKECRERVEVVRSPMLPWAFEVPVCGCVHNYATEMEDRAHVAEADLDRAVAQLEEVLDEVKKIPSHIEARIRGFVDGQNAKNDGIKT